MGTISQVSNYSLKNLSKSAGEKDITVIAKGIRPTELGGIGQILQPRLQDGLLTNTNRRLTVSACEIGKLRRCYKSPRISSTASLNDFKTLQGELAAPYLSIGHRKTCQRRLSLSFRGFKPYNELQPMDAFPMPQMCIAVFC